MPIIPHVLSEIPNTVVGFSIQSHPFVFRFHHSGQIVMSKVAEFPDGFREVGTRLSGLKTNLIYLTAIP